MDRYEVKREIERAFAKDEMHRMESIIREADPTFVADLLQQYMEEAENIHVYRRELEDLRAKIKELNNKSGQRVRCIKPLPNRRALVQLGPIKEELILSPNVDASKLHPGCEVLVIGSGEGRILAEIREGDLDEGRLGKVSRVLPRKRAVIEDGGHEMVFQLAEGIACKEGDEVRYDPDAHMVVELIGNTEASPFVLAERPTTTFSDIKGLDEEKTYLKERIIYPAIHSEKFKMYGLKPIRGALLHGPPGCGKAQPLDAKIVTPSGYIRMGDVSVGSVVSTPDGGCATVLGVFPQGEIDIYRIVFSDDTSTECCLDHLWQTNTKDDRDAKRRGSVKTLRNIVSSLRYGTDERRNHAIPMTKPVEFVGNTSLLPLDPYLMGLLLGDGGLSGKSPMLTTSDQEIVERVKQLLPSGITIKKVSNSKYDYRLVGPKHGGRQTKNVVMAICDELGICGCRAWEKFVPQSYKLTSVDARIALLQGLLDSDGTVTTNGCGISFSSSSYRLAEDVKFVVKSLGGVVSTSEKFPSYTYLGQKRTGRKSFRIYISLPSSIQPFRLERKRQAYIPHTKYPPARFIDRVEFVGKKQAQCIMVDHPDHLYLTDDFIVTHNTMVAKGIFNEMLRMKFGALNYVAGFFVVNGPEMLNKWAGNTESSIRSLFQAAREAAAKSDFPSVIFWDEIESITGRRKDTETYTPEKTVVPTLLAELQGLEDSANVILIGATNRPDLIDPALMRPGRLGDAILEIPRPDKEAAGHILEAIFGKEHKPAGLQNLLDHGIAGALSSHVYDNEVPLAYARLKNGATKPLMRQEMASGALFAQIGEELVYKCCLAEINGTECPTDKEAIEMIDNILLTQIGVLDAGVKSGFTIDPSNYVIDVSLDA